MTCPTYMPRGEKHPRSKLNDDLVRRIRSNPNGWSAKRWAAELGLHPSTIEFVRMYRTWAHVR